MINPPEEESYERQYKIDQITARYEDELRAGKSPKIADYIQRYPQYAQELAEFALFHHTVGLDQPEPGAPQPGPSAAAQAARARIHEQVHLSTSPPLEGLMKQGRLAGYMAPKLAEMVGLSLDILAKLDAHAITGTSIPQTLIERLADTLRVAQERVAAYLGSPQAASRGAFFYASQAPQQRQESFLDAVQNSAALSAEAKQEWAEITRRDNPAT